MLGNVPRKIMGVTAEADLIGRAPQTLSRNLQELASAVHWSSRAWLGSLCSHLRTLVITGEIEVIAAMVHRMYDSTSMKLTMTSGRRGMSSPEFIGGIGDLAQAGQSSRVNTKSISDAKVCKIMQMECSVGFVFRRKQSDVISFVRCPVTCPLQVSDHETAEAIMAMEREQTTLPMLDELFSVFPNIFRSSRPHHRVQSVGTHMYKVHRCGLPKARPAARSHSGGALFLWSLCH
jgi:hypothetical protein